MYVWAVGDLPIREFGLRSLRAGNSVVSAPRSKDVPLFSDLALHRMGAGLADQIAQGRATGDEFRQALRRLDVRSRNNLLALLRSL